MTPIDLTLVIPSYNRATLVADTVRSALEQTRPFAKIIVVDDASTDDTLDVLRQFGDAVTVIAAQKGGVQVARNAGVAAADTAFVTLCDSDDLLHKAYSETVGGWLERHPLCDSVYSNFRTFGDDRPVADKFAQAPAGYFDGAIDEEGFLCNVPDLYAKTAAFQPLFPTGLTIRKAVYEKLGGFDRTFNGVGSEDWEFTLRVLEHGNVALCRQTLVQIRKHASNDSKDTLRQLAGEITVLEHALARHRAGARHAQALADGIDRRRLAAFELAFGTGKYADAATLLPLIRHKPGNMKFRVKQVLTRLYGLKGAHPGRPAA